MLTIKNKIMEVTYDKFSKKGYSSSLREIAKKAGLKNNRFTITLVVKMNYSLK